MKPPHDITHLIAWGHSTQITRITYPFSDMWVQPSYEEEKLSPAVSRAKMTALLVTPHHWSKLKGTHVNTMGLQFTLSGGFGLYCQAWNEQMKMFCVVRSIYIMPFTIISRGQHCQWKAWHLSKISSAHSSIWCFVRRVLTLQMLSSKLFSWGSFSPYWSRFEKSGKGLMQAQLCSAKAAPDDLR